MEDLLNEFIEYLRWCGHDALFVFEETDQAINDFLKQREKDDQ
jgi:hypothetical protein